MINKQRRTDRIIWNRFIRLVTIQHKNKDRNINRSSGVVDLRRNFMKGRTLFFYIRDSFMKN